MLRNSFSFSVWRYSSPYHWLYAHFCSSTLALLWMQRGGHGQRLKTGAVLLQIFLSFRWYHWSSSDLIYPIHHDYYETNWDENGCFWGARGNVTRRARAVNKPTPVDCIMGRWSSWTSCNSCTDKKVRVFFSDFSVNLSKVFFNQINVYSSLQKHCLKVESGQSFCLVFRSIQKITWSKGRPDYRKVLN